MISFDLISAVSSGDQKTKEHLRAKRLELIYKQSIITFIGNAIAGLLVTVLFWQKYNPTILSIWLLTNTLVLAFRSGASYLYNSSRLAGKSYEWCFNIFNTGSVLTGILWGIIAIYICAFGTLTSCTTILIIIAGIVAGSFALNAASFPSFTAFSWSALVPISMYFLLMTDSHEYFLGIFALFFLGILTIMSYSMNKMIFRYFSYETENIKLIEKLAEEKGMVMKLNKDLNKDLKLQKKIETELKNEKLKVESLVEKLLKLSTIDGLTGIPNRRHFDEYMGKEWSRCAREQISLSLILCDIDHFKDYNDHYGHLKGDNCLRKIASTLSEHARRGGDMAARYGGEEFAIILPNTNLDNAIILAQQVHQAVRDMALEHKASATDNIITASFGVASIIPNRDILSSTLISLADKAMYKAKQGGRNRVVSMKSEDKIPIKSFG